MEKTAMQATNKIAPPKIDDILGNSRGFSMVEMLLTVILFGGVMLLLFQVLEDLAAKELAKSSANYMEKVAEAVEETLGSDLNNFMGFYNNALLDSAQDNAEFGVAFFIAGGNVGATAPRFIPASSTLNANFSDRNPHRQDIRILMSVADDPLDPNDPPALDILIVANGRAPDEKVRQAASEADQNGGFFRASTDPLNPNDQITGAFGTWSIPIGRFLDLPWYANVQANLPSIDDGSYLVQRLYMNALDISGDYLFRTPQSNTDLHTMLTTLNLGGNNIVGVDNLTTSGNVTVNSQVIVQGTAYVDGDLSVQGSLYGDGQAEVAGNTWVDYSNRGTGTTGHISKTTFTSTNYNLGGNNNILSLGDVQIGTLNVTGTGTISAPTATLRNVSTAEIDTAKSGGAGGTATISGDFNAGADSFVGITRLGVAGGATVDISEELQATDMNFAGAGTSLTVPSGRTGIVNFKTDAQMSVSGTFSAPRSSVQDFEVDTFGNCDEGCGL